MLKKIVFSIGLIASFIDTTQGASGGFVSWKLPESVRPAIAYVEWQRSLEGSDAWEKWYQKRSKDAPVNSETFWYFFPGIQKTAAVTKTEFGDATIYSVRDTMDNYRYRIIALHNTKSGATKCTGHHDDPTDTSNFTFELPDAIFKDLEELYNNQTGART
jgi:hypothetical protein